MAGWIGLAAVVGFIYIVFFRKSGKKKAKKKDSKWMGPAVALVILVALAGAGKSAIAGKAIPSYHGPVPAGTLDCAGLEHLWEAAGGSPSTAFLAAEVAMAESSGRQNPPSNAGMNYNGKSDIGYWQVNSGIYPSLATTDPIGNAKAAIIISKNGTDWSAWVTYKKGAEVGQC